MDYKAYLVETKLLKKRATEIISDFKKATPSINGKFHNIFTLRYPPNVVAHEITKRGGSFLIFYKEPMEESTSPVETVLNPLTPVLTGVHIKVPYDEFYELLKDSGISKPKNNPYNCDCDILVEPHSIIINKPNVTPDTIADKINSSYNEIRFELSKYFKKYSDDIRIERIDLRYLGF